MTIADNSFPITVAIIVGVVVQQALTWLKQHGKKTGYNILRPLVLIYWVALGVVMIFGGATQLGHGDLIPNISGIALGLGLMLSGLAQALERGWIKTIGLVVLPIWPVVSGLSFIQSGNELAGIIAFALGLGILLSAVKGWPSGIGQVLVGSVILGSSTIMLISLFVMDTMPSDFANIAIGVAMFALGLWVIANGIMTVLGLFKESSQTAPQSSG